MGAWFPKDKGGIFNLEPLGRTHENCQLPISCHFSPIIYFYQNFVEVVIAWEWEEYGQNSNWVEHHFLNNVFWLHGQVKTQKHSPILPCIHVFLFLAFLKLLCILHSRFCSVLHFPHHWEVVFEKLSGWAPCLMFLLLFSSLPGWEKPFWGCTKNWRRDPQFLGVGWVCFCPREAHRNFWKSNCC